MRSTLRVNLVSVVVPSFHRRVTWADWRHYLYTNRCSICIALFFVLERAQQNFGYKE